MATLETKDFDTLVQDQATAMQGAVAGNLDLTIGSILRALVESNAAVALWLEGLIIRVLTLTRASTSSGVDLDTWVADFGLTRLQGTPATGTVTFSRTLTTNEANIPVGTIVSTDDGIEFEVVASTLGYFEPVQQIYVLIAGNSSVDVPVQAVVSGTSGNVNAGTVRRMSESVPYVDTVTNNASFTTGTEGESDEALRLRFLDFIASLNRATPKAISFAVETTEIGLTHTIIEKEEANGTPKDGHFVVVVDDGTGSPPTSLLNAVSANVDMYRPISSTYEVIAPVQVGVSISANITVDTTVYTSAETDTAVTNAISAHVAGLGVGESLYLTKLAQVAYDASPAVVNISSILVNSATADIVPAAKEIVRPTAVTITVV